MPAAHDIYVEQLRDLRRGHPLYHPEPRPEGPVVIGDVGYIKDGAFRRLFNLSRPANDPIQRFGVPYDFVRLDMGVIDLFDAVLEPGPLHSRTISTISTAIGTPGEILPAEASFHFSCSSKRGAILMLETQMIREEAVQSRRLEAHVIQHCRSWHSFARDLDIHINFGDLMVVTECSKTAAWSSAVYSNSSTEFSLTFSVGMQFATGGIAASSSLEKVGPVERRRSQKRAQENDTPLPKDHTVFIKAYRVRMRQMYFGSLVSLFMRYRTPSPSPGEKELQPPLTPPSQPTSNEAFIIGPHEPDFHAAVTLLALEMEKNGDSECAVVHDNVWCSAASNSDEAQIMEDYTNFYFSDEVSNSLNSFGELHYSATFSESSSFVLDEGTIASPNITGKLETLHKRARFYEQSTSHRYSPFPSLASSRVVSDNRKQQQAQARNAGEQGWEVSASSFVGTSTAGTGGANLSRDLGSSGALLRMPNSPVNEQKCHNCGISRQYRDGKPDEKWGPGTMELGTVCRRCQRIAKRLEVLGRPPSR